MNRRAAAPLAALCALLLPCPALAQTTNTTDLVAGIHTDVADVYGDGSTFIHTRVDGVTYGRPARVHASDGGDYVEVTGTIRGVGWGGVGEAAFHPPPFDLFENVGHYRYAVSFTLRIPDDFDGVLDVYSHGSWAAGAFAFFDPILGTADDELRHLEREGDLLVGRAALRRSRRHAYFAFNSVVTADGAWVATVPTDGNFDGELLPVDPDSAALQAASDHPIPLVMTADVTALRDLTRVAQRLVRRLSGSSVRTTLALGHSAGAERSMWLDTGRSLTQGRPDGTTPRTGGDYVRAYDPTSGRIVDGVIAFAGGECSCTVDPLQPLAAPMMMVNGEGDYFGASVRVAARVAQYGGDVRDNLWLYELRNAPHNFAEIVDATPNLSAVSGAHSDGDRVAPVAAALLDDMVAFLRGRVAPPRSVIDGAAVDVGGVTTVQYTPTRGPAAGALPFVDDALGDPARGLPADVFASDLAPITAGFTSDWQRITAAAPHRAGAVLLPRTRCRQAAYDLSDGNATAIPYADPLAAFQGSAARYALCVVETVAGLERDRLYDRREGAEVVRASLAPYVHRRDADVWRHREPARRCRDDAR